MNKVYIINWDFLRERQSDATLCDLSRLFKSAQRNISWGFDRGWIPGGYAMLLNLTAPGPVCW